MLRIGLAVKQTYLLSQPVYDCIFLLWNTCIANFYMCPCNSF